jgi:hypothetical protein
MPTRSKCAAFEAWIGFAGPDARRAGRLRSSPWSPSSTTDVSADPFRPVARVPSLFQLSGVHGGALTPSLLSFYMHF